MESQKDVRTTSQQIMEDAVVESAGRLLLVDGHAYAYRAFYAIRQLSSPAGAPTNAIYGFIKMLGKMRGALHPTHLVVVWDGGLAVERTALLPEYKAQRPPMPDSLEAQLDGIVSYLQAANIPSICRDGVEADDWIATLARQASAADLNVVIASSDKDFMQLVSPAIGLLNPNDKTEAVWTREQVFAKTGVEPSQIVDWLSLIGDSVDNISGVAGVGAKTAADLLQQFGSVDGLYQRLEEVKSGRLQASLRSAEPTVRRNRRLIRLQDDLLDGISIDEEKVKEGDAESLRSLFAGWGFRSLAAEHEKAESAQRVLI